MGGAEFVLGAFLATSTGWGFSSGWGGEIGVETKHFRLMGSATSEAKQDTGFTYSASATGFLTYGSVAIGGGAAWYGYQTDDWEKRDASPLAVLEYRHRKIVVGLEYVLESETCPAVAGLRIRSAISEHLWLTLSAQRTVGLDATAGEVGLQARW